MENDLSQWEDTKVTITTEEFDKAVKHLAEMEMEYDQVKELEKKASFNREEARRQLLDLFEKSGKSKYQLDGYGTVSKVVKYSAKLPEHLEDKAKLINYFKDLGEEMYLTYVGVNSMSMNSYYNAQLEQDPNFVLPGVEAPTARESISFRKERVKK